MLYDPKWEIETKVDPFKTESLIAWLETKRPEARYSYTCNGHCLLAQYFLAHGFKDVSVTPYRLRHDGQTVRFSFGFENVAVRFPRTFGAALERARSLLTTE